MGVLTWKMIYDCVGFFHGRDSMCCKSGILAAALVSIQKHIKRTFIGYCNICE